MARRYDVSGRLAEGREAVTDTQAYVSACHRRGYRHPELTGYDGQLADRYDSEAGLDLRSLDTDCAALNALADAADDALRTQRRQLVELDNAWRGPGAEAAAEFLRQHCDAAAQLTAGLRAAATGCGALRDELWRLVDTKVAAVLAVDERVGAHRPSWLAAAHAVSSGADDERAGEVVEKQVMPYVDNDVRVEWLAAVGSAKDGIDAAYRAAVATAGPGVGVVFAVPGDLGSITAPDVPRPAAPLPPLADLVDPPVAMPATALRDSQAQPADTPAAGEALDDVPGELGLPGGLGLPGDLGLPSGGLPAGGLGGLGGLIPRLADASALPEAANRSVNLSTSRSVTAPTTTPSPQTPTAPPTSSRRPNRPRQATRKNPGRPNLPTTWTRSRQPRKPRTPKMPNKPGRQTKPPRRRLMFRPRPPVRPPLKHCRRWGSDLSGKHQDASSIAS